MSLSDYFKYGEGDAALVPNAYTNGLVNAVIAASKQPYIPYQNNPLAINNQPSKPTPNTGSILNELLKICPGLARIARPCPVSPCDYPRRPLNEVIVHLNDGHKWSREKIAEWLDIIAIGDPSVDLSIHPKEDKNART